MITKIIISENPIKIASKADIVAKLNHFRKISKAGIQNLTDDEYYKLIAEIKTFFNVELAIWSDTSPTHLFRITNNKNLCYGQSMKLQKVSQLIGPPSHISTIGRCNKEGESVFYAALDLNTAIWEAQPQRGDYITISEWKIKEGEKLNTHAIFNPDTINLSTVSQEAYTAYAKAKELMHPDFAEPFHEVLKFLSEEFMKPVQNNQKREYVFSAIISSRFFNKKPGKNDVKIEAICYPSIKRDLGVTNIAISNSLVLKKLDLIKISVIGVNKADYNEQNKNDLIKISPFITEVETFDFKNDKIIYDSKKELDMIMKIAHETKLSEQR